MLWTVARCSAVGGAAVRARPCAFGKSAGLSEDGDAPGGASTSSCRSLGAAGGPSGSFDCGGAGFTRSLVIPGLVSPFVIDPHAGGGLGGGGPVLGARHRRGGAVPPCCQGPRARR